MRPVVENLADDHAICAYNMTPTDLLRYWLEFIFNAENHNDKTGKFNSKADQSKHAKLTARNGLPRLPG